MSVTALLATTFIIIGESFSVCSFDKDTPRGFCWADYVRKWSGNHFVNLAIGGVGTAELWGKHAGEMTHPLQCSLFRPCWGIVMVGYSDHKLGRTDGEFLGDVVKITEALEAAQVTHTLLVIEPVDHPQGGLTPGMRDGQLAMCETWPERWSCLDLSSMPRSLFPTEDAVHPSPAGQRWIARRVMDQLRANRKRRRARR